MRAAQLSRAAHSFGYGRGGATRREGGAFFGTPPAIRFSGFLESRIVIARALSATEQCDTADAAVLRADDVRSVVATPRRPGALWPSGSSWEV